MYRVLALLSKHPDLTAEEFADHYENRHVPLVLSLPLQPEHYLRHYVQPGDSGAAPDFDVVTQLEFEDRAAYLAWARMAYAPGSGIEEDEKRFLDRASTRSFTVRTES
ncbi:EthD domain-containing protein [Amycolatopsis ultiminotia]|uniref:EthD domain-containing protein n=1 Tax=Amycolatopsis ultiminotia TaxID=543629 RepID=UPI0031EF724A